MSCKLKQISPPLISSQIRHSPSCYKLDMGRTYSDWPSWAALPLPSSSSPSFFLQLIVISNKITKYACKIKMERYPRQRLDANRWQSVVRPQYKYSCAISCLASIFNYLFHRKISLDECIALLFPDLKEDPQNYDFGSQASNFAVQNWFSVICMHYGLSGTSHIIYKEHGRTRTSCSRQEALRNIIYALNTSTCALLYHCLNHYCIIVGYIISPIAPNKLYNECSINRADGHTLQLLCVDGTEAESVDDNDIWLIVADCGRGTGPLRSLTWDFIHKDISTRPPYAYNARHPERGLLRKTESKEYIPVETDSALINNTNRHLCTRPGCVIKGSSHCIIEFVGG